MVQLAWHAKQKEMTERPCFKQSRICRLTSRLPFGLHVHIVAHRLMLIQTHKISLSDIYPCSLLKRLRQEDHLSLGVWDHS